MRCGNLGYGAAMSRGLCPFAVVAVVAGLVLTTGCDCGRGQRPDGRPRAHVNVAWPATVPEVDLEDELRATERNQGRESTVPEEPLPGDLPGVKVREIEIEGLYALEVILGEAEFEDALPLVFLIHGRGDRPRVPGGPFANAPTPMRLILPRAPTALGTGFTWLRVSVTSGRIEELAASLRLRAAHIAHVIRKTREQRPTLGTPIVAGFSQGGMLAFTLAVRHPDVVGEALPMAGWLPPQLRPLVVPAAERLIPIRSAHGTADPVVPFAPTRELIGQLTELGWDAVLIPFEGVEHVMSPEMNAQFELWLEDALARRAPALLGDGLGESGADGADYEPFLPLDTATIEAIETSDQELQDEATSGDDPPAEPSGSDPPTAPEDGDDSAEQGPTESDLEGRGPDHRGTTAGTSESETSGFGPEGAEDVAAAGGHVDDDRAHAATEPAPGPNHGAGGDEAAGGDEGAVGDDGPGGDEAAGDDAAGDDGPGAPPP